jgi:hypothetical protein
LPAVEKHEHGCAHALERRLPEGLDRDFLNGNESKPRPFWTLLSRSSTRFLCSGGPQTRAYQASSSATETCLRAF